ncbi:MAG: retropepsin-like aspartic protease, partial [Gammaproteobacteria bacterium]
MYADWRKSAGVLLLLAMSQFALAVDIEVKALFEGAVMLSVNGENRLVKVGDDRDEGLVLLAADPDKAVVELNGKQYTLTLSERIASRFVAPEKSQVMIRRSGNNQYLTHGSINGRPVRFLVDTGANIMAINADTARMLGIDLAKGEKAVASTASDQLPVTMVSLTEVQVGPIRQRNVRAVV